MRPASCVAFTLAALLSLALSGPAQAQELHRPEVESRMAEGLASTLLDEAGRAEVESLYQSALAQLDLSQGWLARRDEYQALLDGAPARMEAMRVEATVEASEIKPPQIPEGLSLTELEQHRDQSKVALEAALTEQQAVVLEREERDARRTAVPGLAVDARARLTAIDAELAALPAAAEGAVGVELQARRLLTRARQQAVRHELETLDVEVRSYDARGDLIAARRDRAARRVARATLDEQTWRDAAIAARELDAARQAQAARLTAAAASDEHPLVRALADGNRDLAELRTGTEGLVAAIRTSADRLEQVQASLDNLRLKDTSVRAKYEAARLTATIGLLLVKHRAELPDVRVHRQSMENRREQTAEIQLRLIETREDLASALDVEARAAEVLGLLPAGLALESRERVSRTARERLETRRTLLTELESDYNTYVELLTDLDLTEAALVIEAEAFREFIDERILWVRILPPMHEDPQFLGNVLQAAAWLSEPVAWASTLASLPVAIGRRPWEVGSRVLLVLLLLLARPKLRRRADAAGEAVARLRTDRFRFTLSTLLDTALLAAPLPLLIWSAGDLFHDAGRQAAMPRLTDALGTGLVATSAFWLGIELIYRSCRPKGLVEAHFRVHPVGVTLVRSRLRVLVLVGLPALFLEETLATFGNQAMARGAFILGELVLAWFLAGVLHPTRGLLSPAVTRAPSGLLSRTRHLWFALGLGVPLTLAALVELGYVYTARQFELQLQRSILLAVGVAFGHALILRALFVARRRLALQQFNRRKAAALEERGDGDGDEDEDEIDVAAVQEQSRRLVSAAAGFVLLGGMFMIWADVLPALRVLDKVELWTRVVQTVERTPNPAGGPDRVLMVPNEVPVTLGDGLMALVWIVLTTAAARNGPGLLEIALLQHLPMQRAGRYAVTTLARYLITILGTAGAFGALGIGWNEVQWLAAAVSVGLGFGLQEIFANFVSGIILLFERPVRVGDTVTVGSVTGSVSRIQMRATTISTWDETELVVPNKDFITSQLVNWTLSNSVLRVIVKVGIAYGSDTDLANRLLYQVARENDEVLSDPPPRVVFASFGDSTLDFELRCYVDTPELYRIIHHQLNMAIDKAFRTAQITIAFPQRDLHIKSVESMFTVKSLRDHPPLDVGEPPLPAPTPVPDED